MDAHNFLGQILETDDLGATQIHDLADRLLACSCQKHCLNDVIDIVEVSQLLTITENFDRATLENQPQPNAEKSLPSIAHSHARTVRIGKSQAGGGNSVPLVIEQVITLARQFVDPVDIDWDDRMHFIDWKI